MIDLDALSKREPMLEPAVYHSGDRPIWITQSERDEIVSELRKKDARIQRLKSESEAMRDIINPMLNCYRVEIAFRDKEGLSVMNFDPSDLKKALSADEESKK